MNTLSSNTILISVSDTINLRLALLKVLNSQILDSKLGNVVQKIRNDGFKTFLDLPSLFPLWPSIFSMSSICRQSVSGLAIIVEFSQMLFESEPVLGGNGNSE